MTTHTMVRRRPVDDCRYLPHVGHPHHAHATRRNRVPSSAIAAELTLDGQHDLRGGTYPSAIVSPRSYPALVRARITAGAGGAVSRRAARLHHLRPPGRCDQTNQHGFPHRRRGTTVDESITPEQAEAVAQLQRLITNDFAGAPIPNETGSSLTGLVYMRLWTSGSLDFVFVHDTGDAVGFRATGIDPLHLTDLHIRDLSWHGAGTVGDVASNMLDLPHPGGFPIAARPTSPVIVSHMAGLR